jgi:hypothetical protein
MVEIPGARVVNGMTLAPIVIRRERQGTDHPPDPIICETVAKEGAVTAVMLNHEKAHEKAGAWQRDDQAEPIADLEGG